MNDEKEIFAFLSEIEGRGALNYLGATYYIIDKFDMNYNEAKEWDVKWRNHKYKANQLSKLLQGEII